MEVYSEMISLARATDRRAHMRAELDRVGVAAEFHPAYDYTEHDTAETLSRCRPEGPWGVFAIPNMAATISHANAWRRFLDSGASHGLFMEDDIHISPELRDWLADLSWWPEAADIVKFERWGDPRKLVLLEEPGQTHLGRQLKRILTRHMGAAGYMITRDIAARLVAAEPYDMVVDHVLFNLTASRVLKGTRLYQVAPAMIEQGNLPEGATFYMAERKRPSGWPLLRQRLRRAYYELAYPLSTWGSALTGRARFARVAFAAHATRTQPVTDRP